MIRLEFIGTEEMSFIIIECDFARIRSLRLLEY